jgi:hypothetical protein
MAATLILSTNANVAAPTTLTDGTLGVIRPDADKNNKADDATVYVKNTAGTGTITVLATLWGWSPAMSRWIEIGDLNDGAAIGETSSANAISYAEAVAGIKVFTRFWIETTLAGTSPTIEFYMEFGLAW